MTRNIHRARYRLNNAADALRYASSPAGRSSRAAIRAYADKHAGERCFIIGNGPSLRQMDLTPLRGEFTFGLNRFYLLSQEIGLYPTYHVAVNRLVLEQSGAEIAALPVPKFVSWRGRDVVPAADDVMFIRPQWGEAGFSTDVSARYYEGSTVTYAAMQIAYYMGFRTVYLIGVDHNFERKGPAHQTVITETRDADHFHPDYFGKGYRWQLPDLEGSERAYWLAKAHYEADGRTIYDATVGGKLTVYPKVDFAGLFGG